MEWITCDNVYEESWRRLLEFANVELAVERIAVNFGTPSRGDKSNYRKQATQIRVSLLQAREYFEAAKQASLFTKPNLLYYGIVSLATASMLINGGGEKSLDYLRKNKDNSHHGLIFTHSLDHNNSKIGLNLIEKSHVEICAKGHFKNWYETINKSQAMYALRRKHDENSISTGKYLSGEYRLIDFENIVGVKHTLFQLIAQLPDIIPTLSRYGTAVDYARGSREIDEYTQHNTVQDVFIFHQSSSYESLMKIVDRFTCDGVYFEVNVEHGKASGAVKTKKGAPRAFSFPDSRETMDHRSIYYTEEINVPEAVDFYLLSYALSMHARYLPDIWVSFLESHCKGAKLIEQVVNLLVLKMPNLMLNQISGSDLVISTHRPTWH